MHSSLELVLLLLGAAVIGVAVFRMLHLPPMLAYLAVGILIGPHAFGLVGDNETMHSLAEFGVVFLMFSIGLEFSLPQLMSMRRLVFGLGMAQVLISIAVVMAVSLLGAYWLPSLSGITWQAAFALSGAMAMSSTAIVSKMMAERLELETEHGRRIFGILLFQDLALVPLLILVPALANNPKEVWVTLGLAMGKAIVVLVLLLLVGQRLMRRWFHVVVKRGTLTLKAGKVVVKQDPEGYQFAILYAAPGKLASYRQKRDGGPDLWMEGYGQRIEYDNKSEIVNFYSKAKLKRLEGNKVTDEVKGEHISYDSKTEFFTVHNTSKGVSAPGAGRIKVILQPKETKAGTGTAGTASEKGK